MSIFPIVSVVKQSPQALKSVDVHCDQADRYHRQTRFPNPCDVFTQTRENYYSPRASLPAVPTAATRDRIYGFSACGPASQRNSDDYRFQRDKSDPSVLVFREIQRCQLPHFTQLFQKAKMVRATARIVRKPCENCKQRGGFPVEDPIFACIRISV